MNLDPQRRGGRRSRRFAWAFVLLAGMWGAAAARADISVHVMNCTEYEVIASAYDAKDSVRVTPASQVTIDVEGEGKSLHCAGEGEGYCQMAVSINLRGQCAGIGGTGDFTFHLESGKWAVVTASGESSCELGVEKNLDSTPSCS